MNKLIEGWELSPMYTVQSGAPLGFGNFIFYGDPTKIVLPRGERTIQRWFNTSGFEIDSRKQRQNAVVYTSTRFSGLRSAGLNFLDFSAMKKIHITERVSVDFRADFMNELNHTVFNAPNTTPTSTTFGQITSAVDVPRTIQFGFVGRF